MLTVQVLMMDGIWKAAGRLQVWDGKRWTQRAFATTAAARAAIAAEYGDMFAEAPDSIRIVPVSTSAKNRRQARRILRKIARGDHRVASKYPNAKLAPDFHAMGSRINKLARKFGR